MKKIIVSRDKRVFLKVFKQLVRPNLTYASVVWSRYMKSDVQPIEKVQRRANKHCTSRLKSLHNKSYAERLQILKLVSLQKKQSFIVLVEICKIIHDLTPSHSFQFLKAAYGISM